MDGKEVKPEGGKFETFEWCKNLGDEHKLIPACSNYFKDTPLIERSSSNTCFSLLKEFLLSEAAFVIINAVESNAIVYLLL